MKKIVSLILIYALLLQTGCYSEKWVSKENLKEAEDYRIHVITYNNREYYCASKDWYAKKDTLIMNNVFSRDKNDKQKTIPFDSIKEIYMIQFNTGKTIAVITPIILLSTLLIIALSNFHPLSNSHF